MPVIEYKCPNCGSGMMFDSVTGALSCPSCGRKDDIEQLPDPLKRQVFEAGEVKEYHCTSCGAVIVTEPETSATTCSFCGSAVVLADRLSGELAPAKVIPFSIGKEEAKRAFKKWCKKGLLTPSFFMTADRIKGITGIYVPFWLYELHNKVVVSGTGTKIRTYTQGDFDYTETRHFNIYRRIRLNFVNLPIDASAKMNDELMDKLEPFPQNKMKEFKTPYLAGYIAEKYSYTDEELLPRAKDKMMPYIDEYVSSTVSQYNSVSFTDEHIDTAMKKADYALLPVWMVQYDYKGKEYTFAMNGHTGKIVGKPPISKVKVTAWFTGIAGISFVALKTVSWIMGGGFL